VLDDVERDWMAAGDAVTRLAACFALKEAAIKALGARPRPFSWTSLRSRPTADGPPWMASILADLGAGEAVWASVNDAPAAWGLAGDAVVAVVAVVSDRRQTDTAAARTPVAGNGARAAGRQAADAAVRLLLADANARVTIEPGVHPPDDPSPCRGSHPPVVLVDARAGAFGVSISHSPAVAVAVAWRR
jgi:phosphopantetheinyl transferase (holo-ACP synthase)